MIEDMYLKLLLPSKQKTDFIIRLLCKVKPVPHPDFGSPCWEWQGATSGNGRGGGYGRMFIKGQNIGVHRVTYAMVHGHVSRKKQIDHKCRNRLCCNPDHLEEVTNQENQRRKNIKYEQLEKQN